MKKSSLRGITSFLLGFTTTIVFLEVWNKPSEPNIFLFIGLILINIIHFVLTDD